jgi:predicted DNA-binding transcriptional regulator AlpA
LLHIIFVTHIVVWFWYAQLVRETTHAGVEYSSASSGTVVLMPREEEPVVGLSEVAEMLDVNKHTAKRYVAREDFPAPIASLAMGPVWRRNAVERWATKTLPLPQGRPPKGKPR